MKTNMIRLAQEIIVEIGYVEPADLELVRKQELRDGETDAGGAARHDGDLAEAEGVNCDLWWR